jgi:hypothetical protein
MMRPFAKRRWSGGLWLRSPASWGAASAPFEREPLSFGLCSGQRSRSRLPVRSDSPRFELGLRQARRRCATGFQLEQGAGPHDGLPVNNSRFASDVDRRRQPLKTKNSLESSGFVLSTSTSADASSQQKSAGYHKRQSYDEERRFDLCQFPIATHGAPQLLTTPAQDVFEYLTKG